MICWTVERSLALPIDRLSQGGKLCGVSGEGAERVMDSLNEKVRTENAWIFLDFFWKEI